MDYDTNIDGTKKDESSESLERDYGLEPISPIVMDDSDPWGFNELETPMNHKKRLLNTYSNNIYSNDASFLNTEDNFNSFSNSVTKTDDGYTWNNRNKYYQNWSLEDIQNVMAHAKSNELVQGDDGKLYTPEGEEYIGDTRWFYAFGTYTDGAIKIGTSSMYPTQRYTPNSDGTYGWVSGPGGVNVDDLKVAMLLPADTAIGLEGAIHGNTSILNKRLVKGIGSNNELIKSLGGGYTEVYDESIINIFNLNKADLARGAELANEILERQKSINKAAADLAVAEYEFENQGWFKRGANIVGATGGGLIGPIVSSFDGLLEFHAGIDIISDDFIEGAYSLGSNQTPMVRANKELEKAVEIFFSNKPGSEKAKAALNAVLEAYSTPEYLGSSVGYVIALTAATILGRGAVNKLTKNKKVAGMAGGVLGLAYIAAGEVNDQYKRYVENNGGRELEGTDKYAWYFRSMMISIATLAIEKGTFNLLLNNPVLAPVMKGWVKSLPEKSFLNLVKRTSKKAAEKADPGILKKAAVEIPKWLGAGVVKGVFEAGQEGLQSAADMFNARYGTQYFGAENIKEFFLSDKETQKEILKGIIGGFAGGWQYQTAGGLYRSGVKGINLIRGKGNDESDNTLDGTEEKPTNPINFEEEYIKFKLNEWEKENPGSTIDEETLAAFKAESEEKIKKDSAFVIEAFFSGGANLSNDDYEERAYQISLMEKFIDFSEKNIDEKKQLIEDLDRDLLNRVAKKAASSSTGSSPRKVDPKKVDPKKLSEIEPIVRAFIASNLNKNGEPDYRSDSEKAEILKGLMKTFNLDNDDVKNIEALFGMSADTKRVADESIGKGEISAFTLQLRAQYAARSKDKFLISQVNNDVKRFLKTQEKRFDAWDEGINEADKKVKEINSIIDEIRKIGFTLKRLDSKKSNSKKSNSKKSNSKKSNSKKSNSKKSKEKQKKELNYKLRELDNRLKKLLKERNKTKIKGFKKNFITINKISDNNPKYKIDDNPLNIRNLIYITIQDLKTTSEFLEEINFEKINNKINDKRQRSESWDKLRKQLFVFDDNENNKKVVSKIIDLMETIAIAGGDTILINTNEKDKIKVLLNQLDELINSLEYIDFNDIFDPNKGFISKEGFDELIIRANKLISEKLDEKLVTEDNNELIEWIARKFYYDGAIFKNEADKIIFLQKFPYNERRGYIIRINTENLEDIKDYVIPSNIMNAITERAGKIEEGRKERKAFRRYSMENDEINSINNQIRTYTSNWEIETVDGVQISTILWRAIYPIINKIKDPNDRTLVVNRLLNDLDENNVNNKIEKLNNNREFSYNDLIAGILFDNITEIGNIIEKNNSDENNLKIKNVNEILIIKDDILKSFGNSNNELNDIRPIFIQDYNSWLNNDSIPEERKKIFERLVKEEGWLIYDKDSKEFEQETEERKENKLDKIIRIVDEFVNGNDTNNSDENETDLKFKEEIKNLIISHINNLTDGLNDTKFEALINSEDENYTGIFNFSGIDFNTDNETILKEVGKQIIKDYYNILIDTENTNNNKLEKIEDTWNSLLKVFNLDEYDFNPRYLQTLKEKEKEKIEQNFNIINEKFSVALDNFIKHKSDDNTDSNESTNSVLNDFFPDINKEIRDSIIEKVRTELLNTETIKFDNEEERDEKISKKIEEFNNNENNKIKFETLGNKAELIKEIFEEFIKTSYLYYDLESNKVISNNKIRELIKLNFSLKSLLNEIEKKDNVGSLFKDTIDNVKSLTNKMENLSSYEIKEINKNDDIDKIITLLKNKKISKTQWETIIKDSAVKTDEKEKSTYKISIYENIYTKTKKGKIVEKGKKWKNYEISHNANEIILYNLKDLKETKGLLSGPDLWNEDNPFERVLPKIDGDTTVYYYNGSYTRTPPPPGVEATVVNQNIEDFIDIRIPNTILNTLPVDQILEILGKNRETKFLVDQIKKFSNQAKIANPDLKKTGNIRDDKSRIEELLKQPAFKLIYDENGEVKDKVIVAAFIAMQIYMNNSKSLLNADNFSKKDLAHQLNRQESQINDDMVKLFTGKGVFAKHLYNSVGKIMADMLGLKEKNIKETNENKVDDNAYSEVITNLGEFALTSMDPSIIKTDNPPIMREDYLKALGDTVRDEDEEIILRTISFKKDNKNKKNNINLNKLDNTAKTLEKLFDIENSQENNVHILNGINGNNDPNSKKREGEEKIKGDPFKTRTAGLTTSKAAKISRNTVYTVSKKTFEFILKNKDYTKHHLGFIDEKSLEFEVLSYPGKEKQKGINLSIDTALKGAEKFLEKAENEGVRGDQIELNFDFFIAVNGRFHNDDNMINPQAEKLFRFLVTPKSLIKTRKFIDGRFYYNNKEYTNDIHYALAQAFGMSVDKKSTDEYIAFGEDIIKAFTSGSREENVKKIEDTKEELIKSKSNKIDVIISSGNYVSLKIEEFGHTIQGFEFLLALAERDGNGDFTTTLSNEVDSIASGVAIRFLQFPVLSNIYGHLKKVGIIKDHNNESMNMNDRIATEEGFLDVYESLAVNFFKKPYDKLGKVRKTLNPTREENKILDKDTVKKFWNEIVEVIPLGEEGSDKVSSELRKLGKPGVMTSGYGAQPDSIRRSITNNVYYSLLDKLADPNGLKDKAIVEILKLIRSNLEVDKNSVINKKSTLKEVQEYIRDYPFDRTETKKVKNTIINLLDRFYGDITETTLEEEYGEVQSITDVINDGTKALFRVFKATSNIKFNEFRRRENNHGVTKKEKQEIINELIKILSITGPDEDGNIVIASAVTASPNSAESGSSGVRHYANSKALKNLGFTINGKEQKSVNSQILAKVLEESYSGGSVLPIHHIDAYIMAKTIIELKEKGIDLQKEGIEVTHIHDALLAAPEHTQRVVQVYNKNFFEVSLTYNFLDHLELKLHEESKDSPQKVSATKRLIDAIDNIDYTKIEVAEGKNINIENIDIKNTKEVNETINAIEKVILKNLGNNYEFKNPIVNSNDNKFVESVKNEQLALLRNLEVSKRLFSFYKQYSSATSKKNRDKVRNTVRKELNDLYDAHYNLIEARDKVYEQNTINREARENQLNEFEKNPPYVSNMAGNHDSGFGDTGDIIKRAKKSLNDNKFTDMREEYGEKDILSKAEFEGHTDKELEDYKNKGITVISKRDDLYPKKLLEVGNPPDFLYVKGDVSLLNKASVAVVGARKSTETGKKETKSVVKAMAHRGYTIVSGLAYGIDRIAHEAALDNNLKTIAVLADVNNPYTDDTSERKLAKEIVDKGGLLISENKPGSVPKNKRGPKLNARDRITAALSSGVFVMEAEEDSGSLNAPRVAKGLGRVVYIPDYNSIRYVDNDKPQRDGLNQLIEEKTVETFTDKDFDKIFSRLNDIDSDIDQDVSNLKNKNINYNPDPETKNNDDNDSRNDDNSHSRGSSPEPNKLKININIEKARKLIRSRIKGLSKVEASATADTFLNYALNMAGYGDTEEQQEEIFKRSIDVKLKKVNKRPNNTDNEDGNVFFQLTDDFKKWFKNSQVIDESGEPLKVYHGTNSAGFEIFKSDTNAYWFTENFDMAEGFVSLDKVDLFKRKDKNAIIKDIIDNPEKYNVKFEKLGNRVYSGSWTYEKDEGDYDYYNGENIIEGWIPNIVKETIYSNKFSKEEIALDLYDIIESKTEDTKIYRTYLSMQNPYVYDAKGNRWDSIGESNYWTIEKRYKDGSKERLHEYDNFGFNSHIYFKSKEEAEEYIRKDKSKNNFINMNKTVDKLKKFLSNSEQEYEIVKVNDKSTIEASDLVRKVQAGGKHDGVIIKNVSGIGGISTYYIVFKPEQIKSTENTGGFNGNNPNIFYKGIKGQYDVRTQTISVFKDGDFSTVMHESAHMMLDNLLQLADSDNPPQKITDLVNEIYKEFNGSKKPKTTEELIALHEKFAEGFEVYMKEGKAPNREMKGLFDRIKALLKDAYEKIKMELTDGQRGVYDKLFTNKNVTTSRGSSSNGENRDNNDGERVKDYEHGNVNDMENMVDRLSSSPNEQIDSSEKNRLKSVLRLLNPAAFEKNVKLFINNFAENTRGEVVFKPSDDNSLYATEIKIGLNANKRSSSNQSAASIYVEEVIHTVTEGALKANTPESKKLRRQLQKIMNITKKKISKKDLTDATGADWLYDYIFGEEAESEFTAKGLADPNIEKLLKAIPIKVKDKKTSVLEMLKKVFGNLVDFLNGSYIPSKHNNNVHEALVNIVAGLQEINTVNQRKAIVRSGVLQSLYNLFEQIDFMSADLLNQIGDKLRTLTFKGNMDRIPEMPTSGIMKKARWYIEWITRAVSDGHYANGMRIFANMIGEVIAGGIRIGSFGAFKPNNIFKAEGELSGIFNDLRVAGELEQVVDRHSMKVKTIDGLRERTKNIQRELILGRFKNNTPSKEEEELITKVIADTDMSILFKKLDKEEIIELLTNNDSLEKLLKTKAEKLKSKDSSSYEWRMNQAEGLGNVLAGKISGGVNQLLNAQNIERGILRYKKRKKFDKEAVKLIDEIATLFALKETSLEDRKKVANLVDKEYDAITFITDQLEGFKKESKKHLFNPKKNKDKDLNMIKGYTKNILDSNIAVEFVVIGSKEGEELVKKGYKLEKIVNINDKTNNQDKDTGFKPIGIYVGGVGSNVDMIGGAIRSDKFRSIGTNLTDIMFNERKEEIENTIKEKISRSVEEKGRGLSEEEKYDIRETVEKEVSLKVREKINDYIELTKKATGIMENNSYDTTNPLSILQPSLGLNKKEKVKIVDYRIVMDKDTKKKIFTQDTRISEVLASSFGSIVDKVESQEHNNEITKVLMEHSNDYFENKPKGKAFSEMVFIGPSSEDPVLRKKFYEMPKVMRNAIMKTEKKVIAIPASVYNSLFDTKHLTIIDAPGINKLPAVAKRLLQFGEKLWTEVVKIAKVNTLLKIPDIIFTNIISNFNYLILQGNSPVKVLKAHRDSYRELVEYNRITRKLIELKSLNTKTDEQKTEIKYLEEREKKNMFNELMALGLDQNIEDLTINADRDPNLVTDFVERELNKAPKFVRIGTDWVYLTKKTPVYRLMKSALSMSDLVARGVQNQLDKEKTYQRADGKAALPVWWVNEMRKTRPNYKMRQKLSGLDRDKFLKEAQKIRMENIIYDYVVYEKPSGRVEEYLERMGIFMFVKYVKRIQRIIYRSFSERPLGTLIQSGLNSTLGFPSIFESSLLMKPWGFGPGEALPFYGPFEIIGKAFLPGTYTIYDSMG